MKSFSKNKKEIAIKKINRFLKNKIQNREGYITWKATFTIYSKNANHKPTHKPIYFNSFGSFKNMDDIIEAETAGRAEKYENESPTIGSVEVPRIYKKRFQPKKTPANIKKTIMKKALAIDIENYVSNKEWNTGTGHCVPDCIIHQFKDVKGFKKKLNYIDIENRSVYDASGVKYPDVWENPNEKGYCINHIERWCDSCKVSLYVLQDGKKLISRIMPHNTGLGALVFTIKNNHIYPIFDKKTRSGVIRGESFINKDKLKEKETLVCETVILEHYVKGDDSYDTKIEQLSRLVERINMQPKDGSLIMKDGSLCNFKFNNKITNEERNINLIIRITLPVMYPRLQNSMEKITRDKLKRL